MRYEISLWRDGNADSSVRERKVLDIPSAKDSPIGASTPTLTQNINGMKEFSFSLLRHYMDNGKLEKNPLIGELVEESKIKVLVGKKWHDFIIKNIGEDKESDKIFYSCQDLASVELGKRGTEIVLNTELENNYGTVEELAKKVLKYSGYSLGEDSEKPYESKEEALYIMRLDTDLSAIRAVDSAEIKLKKGDYIYLPYASVEWDSSKDKWIKGSKYERKGYQILWKNGEVFNELDLQEGRVVYDPEFQYNLILNDLPTTEIFLAGSVGDQSDSASMIKGRFLQESVVATYEPIMDRMIEKVEVINSAAGVNSGTIVNKYTQTEYWTSDITKNLLLNAKDFTSTNMWEPNSIMVGGLENVAKTKTIVTGHGDYKNVLMLPKVESSYKNISLVKTGIKFSPGDKLVYGVRVRSMKEKAKEVNEDTISTQESPTLNIYLQDAKTQEILSYGTPKWEPNNDIDLGLPGAGSKPERMEAGKTYVYNGYAYGLLEIGESVDEPEFVISVDPTDEYPLTLEDIQLFRYVTHNGKMIFPEDIPTAEAVTRNHYYVIENGEELRLTSNDSYYKPVIRANYEAVRHIEVEQDSYFNNINVLAEKFNMWVDFHYERDKNGAILEKYVSLYRFNPLNTTNWAGFKYGINLANIHRNVNSSQITTKLIVPDNNNQFGKNGTASIKRAKANTYGESTIWNFDFYINKGLLNKDDLARDMYGYNDTDLGIFTHVRSINKELAPLTNRVVNMTADLAQSEAFLVVEQEKANKSIKEVERLTTLLAEYQDMLEKHGGGIASQSIKNTQAALEKAYGHYFEANYEQNKLMGRIEYYKEELNRGIDQYKGIMDANDIREGKIRAGDYFIYNAYIYQAKGDIKGTHQVDRGSTILDESDLDVSLGLKRILLLDLKRALTHLFEEKYHRYVSEGQWVDPNQIDDNAYYADAQVLSANNALPQVEYEVNLTDIGLLDDYKLYSFNVGDSTFVEDIEFFGSTKQLINGISVATPYKKAVVIMESRQVLDDPGQSSIVVKTYKGTHKDLISRVSYGLNSLQKELNSQSSRISETEKLGTDAKANRFLFENVLNNISDRIEQYSEEFAFELANAPGVTLEWLNQNVGVLDGNVLATNSIKTAHLESGVVKAISAEVSLLVADALKANKAFIQSLEAEFGKFELLNTGRIESADGSSWWDLDTGEMNISKAVDDRLSHSFKAGGEGFEFVTRQIEGQLSKVIQDADDIEAIVIEYAGSASSTLPPKTGWSEDLDKVRGVLDGGDK